MNNTEKTHKLGFNRETIIPLAVSLFFTLSAFNGFLMNAIWIFAITAIFILVITIAALAGYAVTRSLVRVSAGLTLIIFLAQTYCDLETKSQSGVEAMKGIFSIVIMCLLFDFFKSLYIRISENIKKIRAQEKSARAIILNILLVAFVGLFLYWIYLVLTPIFSSLCILN